MHLPALRTTITLCIMALGVICHAADVEESIKATCKSELSGNDRMIKFCISQETGAYLALNTYHPTLKPIIDECQKKVGKHGWSMLKMCTDKQILAEKVIFKSS